MNYRHLTYFIEVYETKSIVEAAKKLYISSQGLGQGVHRLEKSIGIQLLKSTPSGLEPTEFGKVFYEKAKQVLREFNELENLVNQNAGAQNTSVTIGISGVTKYARGLQDCVDAYHKANPASALRIKNVQLTSRAELVENVRSGQLDMGMMFHSELHPDFEHCPFSEFSRLMVLVSRDNPLSLGSCVSLTKLSQLRFIFPAENDPFTDIVRELFSKHGVECNTLYNTTEYNMIGRLVDNDKAGMLIREKNCAWILPFCSNSVLLPVEPEIRLTNSIFWKKDRAFEGEKLQFINWAKEYFDTMVD